MTCVRAQSLITPFINDQLNMNETQEFIDHVNTCTECKEELEVYYALLTAMKQLDEDKNLSDDFSLELSAKLERAQEKIIHIKFTYYRKKGMLFLIILMLAFFINFRYANTQQQEGNPITVSKFQLRRTFRHERYELLEKELRNHLNTQKFKQ